jgi:RNA polymerase sigma-70 factor (ECF subfamily)
MLRLVTTSGPENSSNDAAEQHAALDLALMRRVAAREPHALRALYDRYGGLVYTVVQRILRDRGDAEEVLGDVFWELWRCGDRFDPARGTLMRYLITLARSRAIDRARARVAAAARMPTLRQDEAPEPAARLLATPQAIALAGERRAVVRRALAQLAPHQRQVIECAFFEGLSHSEIAQRLERPLGSVKTHIRRGLLRLRQVLGSSCCEAAA